MECNFILLYNIDDDIFILDYINILYFLCFINIIVE